MSPLQRLIVGFTAIGLATTVLSSERNTEGVVTATGSALSKVYYTLVSGKRP